ncbi:hypothetical protein SCALM49S_03422 [Streptomyces californicus]
MLVSFFSLVMLTSMSSAREFSPMIMPWYTSVPASVKMTPRSWRLTIANGVTEPARSATSEPLWRVRSSPNHGSWPSKMECAMPVPRVWVRNSVRKPMRPRDGTIHSMRTQPEPWFVMVSMRPLRVAMSWVMAPRCSSGESIVMRSMGSYVLPSICLVTTSGLPTVSSKPSRRICSTRMASASSPRPWTSQASGRSVSRTRSETLPISSRSRRSFTWRAVTLWPLPPLPTSGEVLVPMVMEMAGSSTVISGSAIGFSGSASVSPIMMSGMPAMAQMSPGPATSAGLRVSASVISSSVMRTLDMVPSRLIQVTVWPLRSSPCSTRQSAMRPRKLSASRLVTWAWSGASASNSGAGTCARIVLKNGSRLSLSCGTVPSSGLVSEATPSRAQA